jgi:hypothetical protein
LLSHRADEANALADDCADQPLLFAGIADGAPRRVDPAGDVDSETIRPRQTEASRSS